MLAGSVSAGLPDARWGWAGLLCLPVLMSALLVGCSRSADDDRSERPDAEAHFQAARALELARQGMLHLDIVTPGPGAEQVLLNYTFQMPGNRVEDTEIRGFLDGQVKYDFNQATAYHMRVGRRFAGKYRNRFELKRSLIRWHLPEWGYPAEVESAEIGLWIERFVTDSPVTGGERELPFHLLAYPVTQTWNVGYGGSGRDDFSVAGPGEVTWTSAIKEASDWEAPGALRFSGKDAAGGYYLASPLGYAVVTCADCPISLTGPGLLEEIRDVDSDNPVLDVLLKLEDAQEDLWGTETAIFTSDFGHPWDIPNKRPVLRLGVAAEGRHERIDTQIILEAGGGATLAPVELGAGPHVLAGTFTTSVEDAAVPPAIWIRGGSGAFDDTTDWQILHNPVLKDWNWAQLRVSQRPHAIEWGQALDLRIRETWVKPEPRSEQLPQLYLISPSGKELVVRGRPATDFSYSMAFTPQELGLWRYRWSFRPTPTRFEGSHVGNGVFFVGATTIDSLRAATTELVQRSERNGPSRDAAMDAERLIRELVRFREQRPGDEGLLNDWLVCIDVATSGESNEASSAACRALIAAPRAGA